MISSSKIVLPLSIFFSKAKTPGYMLVLIGMVANFAYGSNLERHICYFNEAMIRIFLKQKPFEIKQFEVVWLS